MGILQKSRFIDQHILLKLDRLCFFISFVYLYFYFSYREISNGYEVFFLIFISAFIYYSKTRRSSVYAALAYAYTIFVILYYYPSFYEKPFLIILPFAIFFIILFKDVSTTLLSGCLYGYWILFIYFMFTSNMLGFERFIYGFSTYQTSEILDHLLFIIIFGVLFFIVSKPNFYVRETLNLKVAFILFLLSFPFIYFLLRLTLQFSDYKLVYPALIYFLLALMILQSIKKQNLMLASVAYALIVFLLFYFIHPLYEIESFYPSLIAPMIVLLLVHYYKISVDFIVGFLLAYWVVQIYFLYQLLVEGYGLSDIVAGIFSMQGIVNAFTFFWMFIIVGALFATKDLWLGKVLPKVSAAKFNFK